MLQKMVDVGTISRVAEGEFVDRTTGQWHKAPIVDREKVWVQSTKVRIIIKNNKAC